MRITELTNRAKAPTTDRTRMFINRVIEESPLLQALNNFGLGAMDHRYRPSAGTQALAARALGGEFTSENLNQAILLAAGLKIHGFALDYDVAYQADHDLGIGVDIDSWLDSELENRAIDTAETLEKLIIAGSGTGDNMLGLLTAFDGNNLPGLGTTGIIDGADGGDSIDLSNEANYSPFMEKFEKWVKDIRQADLIICNDSLAARLTSISKKLNADGETRNWFGVPVDTINRIPIIAVADDVITNTEPNGNGTPVNNTTSMLIVKNRVGHWTVRSNSGLATWDIGELEGKQSNRWKFEMRGFNEIRTKYSARRVENIQLSPSA